MKLFPAFCRLESASLSVEAVPCKAIVKVLAGVKAYWLSKLPDEIIKRRLLQFEAAFFFCPIPAFWRMVAAGVVYRGQAGCQSRCTGGFTPLWGMPSKGRGGDGKNLKGNRIG